MMAKNQERTAEKFSFRDWPAAKVKGRLVEMGVTLRDIERSAGAPMDSIRTALVRGFPKGEILIAEALGVPKEQIWPSRWEKRRRMQEKKGLVNGGR